MTTDARVTPAMPLAQSRAEPGVTRKMTVLKIAEAAGETVGSSIDYLRVARRFFEADYGEKTVVAIEALLLANQPHDVARRFQELECDRRRNMAQPIEYFHEEDPHEVLEAVADALLKDYSPRNDDYRNDHAAIRRVRHLLAARRDEHEDKLRRHTARERAHATTPEMLQEQAERQVRHEHDVVRQEIPKLRKAVEKWRREAEVQAFVDWWFRTPPVVLPDAGDEQEYWDRDDWSPSVSRPAEPEKPDPGEVDEQRAEQAAFEYERAVLSGQAPPANAVEILERVERGERPETNEQRKKRLKKERGDRDEQKMWWTICEYFGPRCALCSRDDVCLVVHHVGGGDGRGERDREAGGGVAVRRRVRRRIWDVRENGGTVSDVQLLCVACHEELHYGKGPRKSGRRVKGSKPPPLLVRRLRQAAFCWGHPPNLSALSRPTG